MRNSTVPNLTCFFSEEDDDDDDETDDDEEASEHVDVVLRDDVDGNLFMLMLVLVLFLVL